MPVSTLHEGSRQAVPPLLVCTAFKDTESINQLLGPFHLGESSRCDAKLFSFDSADRTWLKLHSKATHFDLTRLDLTWLDSNRMASKGLEGLWYAAMSVRSILYLLEGLGWGSSFVWGDAVYLVSTESSFRNSSIHHNNNTAKNLKKKPTKKT